jgi:hypothetical protein
MLPVKEPESEVGSRKHLISPREREMRKEGRGRSSPGSVESAA